MLIIVALIIVLIALAALIHRARMARADKPRQFDANLSPYHAVAVARGSSACGASAALAGRRFLSREAPSLPLAGCKVRPCRCRYVHYADRRSGEDRRFPFGVRKNGERDAAAERRHTDRRKTSDLMFN